MRTYGITLVSLLFAVPALAANLVQDGGFEAPLERASPSCGVANCAGFLTGQSIGTWTVVGPGSQPGYFAILLFNNHYAEGSLTFEPAQRHQSLDVTGSFNQGLNGVQQSVPTVAGKTYKVSFAVGHADRGAYLPDSLVQLVINGTPIATADNANVTPNQVNWRVFSYSFVATGSTTVIGLYNASASSNYVGLDAVSVTKVR